MDIWIISEGEKKGPFHDFEVRRKIGTGELTGSTHAWHEGLDAWKPLEEIEIFAREFRRTEVPASVVEADAPSPRHTPPPLPVPTCYGRRFWARWLDLTIFAGVWWFGMWVARQNIEAALMNPWMMLFRLAPWFIIEILLIHHFATTPGKWLLGLKVLNKDGSKLSLRASTLRSMRVMFIGVGFGWDVLAVFCQTLSYFTAKRLGSPLWDFVGEHKVTVKPLNPLGLVAFVFLFFGSLQLQSLVVVPYVARSLGKTFPQYKEHLERSVPQHLPQRY